MKIKKIICIILVICLLGGLLTISGSADSWLWDSFSQGFSQSANSFIDGYRSFFAHISFWTTGDIEALYNMNGGFKELVTSPSRVWTTTNCTFIGYETLIQFQSLLTRGGVHSILTLQTDKNGVSAFFLKITSVDNEELSEYVGQVLYLQDKYACAVNDNSSAIGGGMGGGGISGGGGGGRRGNSYYNGYDSDDNANNAYESIDGITDIPAIKDNTEETYFYNEFTETVPDVGPIVDLNEGVVYEIGGSTYYDIDVLYYEGDTNSYHIEYTNTNNITEVVNLAYYIQYTVVNYVSLEDTYVLYYELPDGRNSFDMTIDELSQYSGAFDVINYAASADNDDLIALFPFNGNQENIVYNDSPINWTTGNSITYQETSGFGAALYLGDSNHTFSFGDGGTLDTSGVSTQKFTISFRYYYNSWQNPTSVYYPLTVTWQGVGFSYDGYNNAFKIGTSFNTNTGAPNISFSSSYSTPLPTGQWSNITIQYAIDYYYRQVTCYVFLNGIRVGSYTTPQGFSINSSTESDFKVRNDSTTYSYLDELIVFKDVYYGSSVSANFTPALQPYDTNLILTLPSLQAVTVDSYVEDGKTYYYVYTPDQLWKPTIAVATDIHITQYYLGGVRPSLPKRGYVWVPINSGGIGTVQVYDGSGWFETGSRIWNGSRWVESYNYNIHTNGTYSDLAVTVPPPVIADEQSFWAWCVSSFDTLIATIKSVGGGGGAVADPDVIPEIIYPGIDSEGNTTEESTSIFDIVTDIVGGVVDIIGEVVGLGGNVGEFFGDFFDGVGDAFGVLNPNNENGLFYVEVE